jgi:hypothetical protein
MRKGFTIFFFRKREGFTITTLINPFYQLSPSHRDLNLERLVQLVRLEGHKK